MPERRHRGKFRVVLALLAIVLLGCTGDEGDDPSRAQEPSNPTAEDRSNLPPDQFEDLEAIFAPRFEALGMRLTRASMAELDAGPHLQLYIEPTGSFTTQQYVDMIVPSTAAVVPYIFDEWEGLASFDVCQEPPPGVDDSVAPEQVTVVALTREQAAAIEWPNPGLDDLMQAVEGAPLGEVRGNDAVEAFASFQAARAAAS